MTFSDVLKDFLGIAPKIGLAVAAPNPLTIAAAVSSIAGAFGKSPEEMTPDALSALAASPDAVLKFKLAELDFQAKMDAQEKGQQLDELKAQLSDVQSARAMDVDKTKATGRRDVNLYLLAWIITLGFFALVGLLIFHELPKDSNGVVYMLFGSLSMGFGAVVNYFFGSSRGSDKKTDLLSQAEPVKGN